MEFEFAAFFTGLVASIVVPWVAQWLKTATMTRNVKFLIVVALSTITGAVGYVASGYPLNDLVTFITGAITLSLAAYELFWKKVFEDSTTISKWFKYTNHKEKMEVYDGNIFDYEPEVPVVVERPVIEKKKSGKKPVKKTKKPNKL